MSLEDDTIDIIRQFAPPEGYYEANSGGKDSGVLHHLVSRAGVRTDVHYNVTTVDPPELIYFIRRHMPFIKFEHPKQSMWSLIVDKRMPPTRIVRYCCEVLKERGGIGRVVLTGIRGEESIKRGKLGVVELCRTNPGKRLVHPLLNWKWNDIWGYIRKHNLPYCSLYDEGRKRIGCIMCPLAGTKGMERDARRWPKYAEAYKRAFQRCIDKRIKDGLKTEWKTGQQMYNWWLYEQPDYEQYELWAKEG